VHAELKKKTFNYFSIATPSYTQLFFSLLFYLTDDTGFFRKLTVSYCTALIYAIVVTETLPVFDVLDFKTSEWYKADIYNRGEIMKLRFSIVFL
jgi:hypothetical protein